MKKYLEIEITDESIEGISIVKLLDVENNEHEIAINSAELIDTDEIKNETLCELQKTFAQSGLLSMHQRERLCEIKGILRTTALHADAMETTNFLDIALELLEEVLYPEK